MLNAMVIDFMKEQNKFNLEMVQRMSKAEVRIYLILSIASTLVSLAIKYLLP